MATVGPGSYDTNSVRHLNKNARPTIGTQKRRLCETKEGIPGPE